MQAKVSSGDDLMTKLTTVQKKKIRTLLIHFSWLIMYSIPAAC